MVDFRLGRFSVSFFTIFISSFLALEHNAYAEIFDSRDSSSIQPDANNFPHSGEPDPQVFACTIPSHLLSLLDILSDYRGCTIRNDDTNTSIDFDIQTIDGELVQGSYVIPNEIAGFLFQDDTFGAHSGSVILDQSELLGLAGDCSCEESSSSVGSTGDIQQTNGCTDTEATALVLVFILDELGYQKLSCSRGVTLVPNAIEGSLDEEPVESTHSTRRSDLDTKNEFASANAASSACSMRSQTAPAEVAFLITLLLAFGLCLLRPLQSN